MDLECNIDARGKALRLFGVSRPSWEVSVSLVWPTSTLSSYHICGMLLLDVGRRFSRSLRGMVRVVCSQGNGNLDSHMIPDQRFIGSSLRIISIGRFYSGSHATTARGSEGPGSIQNLSRAPCQLDTVRYGCTSYEDRGPLG